MKRHLTAVPLVIAAALFAPAAQAADVSGALLSSAGKRFGDAKTGDWAEFASLGVDGPIISQTMKLQMVADPATPEKRWLEIVMGKSARYAVRIDADDPNAPMLMMMPEGVFTFERKSGDVPTAPACSAVTGGACMAGHDPKAQPRTMKTRAGVFKAQRVMETTPEGPAIAYQSPEAKVLGLVRLELPGNKGGLEIIAQGSNGKSVFPAKYRAVPFPFVDKDALAALLPAAKALEKAGQDAKAGEDGKAGQDGKGADPKAAAAPAGPKADPALQSVPPGPAAAP